MAAWAYEWALKHGLGTDVTLSSDRPPARSGVA
jgi:hypothetical protein